MLVDKSFTKKSFVFLVVVLGSIIAIGPLAIDMYLPAFSAIARYFAVPESRVQLSLASYFIGVALGQILYGPIVDRFGKKIPLLVGLGVFVLTSTLCLFATNIDQIIFLRFLQAIGACSCVVITRAIVRDLFSPQETARVFSYLMLVMGVAPIAAPIFGSLLLANFGWKAIFIFLILFGIALVFATIFFLPESTLGDKDEKMSHAIKKYRGILKDKNFVNYCLSSGFASSGMFCYITGSPFVIIEIFGISPQNYSWIFGANAFGVILFSQINGRLLKKFEMKQILNFTYGVMLIASIMLIFAGINGIFYQLKLWQILVPIFIFISCIGSVNPNGTALSLANQHIHTGSASALFGTIQFTIAAFGAFLVSTFHNNSALPLCFIIGFCGICAFIINRDGQRKLRLLQN